MISLQPVPLSARASAQLVKWQASIDGLGTYHAKVAEAATKFKSRNTRKNKTFDEVKVALEKMCCGARRCCYCEDSAADEVEHISPKNLFPQRVFDWTNYIYACGPCNGPKNNKYAYISSAGTREEFVRGRGDPIKPPPAGQDALIDPRSENPLDFMQLDLAGTFRFVANDADPLVKCRAEWTIEVLDLNKPVLTRGRESAYFFIESALLRYAREKAQNSPGAILRRTKAEILRTAHPTVFLEMQRSRVADQAFQNIPEARAWRFEPSP